VGKQEKEEEEEAEEVEEEKEEEKEVGEQRMCRVYAHRLDHAVPAELLRSDTDAWRWVTAPELAALAAEEASTLRHGGLERSWATMWTAETDAAGDKVMRGFGVANHRMRHLRFQAPPDARGDGVEADREGRYVLNEASLRAVARM
jgi:hypothetical protein